MRPHEALTKEPNPILGPDHKPLNDLGFGPEVKFETRIQAAIRESKAKVAAILEEQNAAEARGELWTVQAALYPNRVFCLIYRGRVESTDAIDSQHSLYCGAIFGPVFLSGKQPKVMAETLDLFTADEITLRVVKGTGIAA